MLQFFDTLADISGNALPGAQVVVTAYPGGGAAAIYSTNGTANPIPSSTVTADATGQVSFYVPDGAYILTYNYNSATYKVRSPVQMIDPTGFVTMAESGTANAYVVNDQRLSAQLYAGLKVEISAGNSCTGASTFNLNGTGAKNLVQSGGSALVAGNILATGIYRFEYDGTNWQVVSVQPVSAALIGGLIWPRNVAETLSAIAISSLAFANTPVYDLQRYGILPNGVDNTSIIQAVYNQAKVSGGTLMFPPNGDYAFYLDISGPSNAQVFINGQGSTLRCFSSTPTQSCVIFANNTGVAPGGGQAGAYSGTNVVFKNCNFTARKFVPIVSTGDVNYAVYFSGASAKFWNCQFNYGAIAAFYGFYAQYSEFWSCQFNLSTASANSAGCVLDSWTTSSSSNEVIFNRCEFFTNSNSLRIKGCLMVRVFACTLQSTTANGIGAIVLEADGSGAFTQGTSIRDCWFEVNAVSHIWETGAQSTTVEGCSFLATSGVSVIFFTHCNGVTFVGNHWIQGGSPIIVSLTHPSTFTDTVSLLWRGNDLAGSGQMIPQSTATFTGNPGNGATSATLTAAWKGGVSGSGTWLVQFPDGETRQATFTQGSTAVSWSGGLSGAQSSAGITIVTLSVIHGGPSYLDMNVQGNYTGTLTGCTTAPTATVYWEMDGGTIFVRIPNLTATSNANSLTITGAPAFILPSASGRYNWVFAEDNGAGVDASAQMTTAGVLAFNKGGNPTGWTTSAVKGALGGMLAYPLLN
jgi:hypothetical protein